jgi:Lrp/AsnC family transcriptional regulator, regulator for asnA, asnC and gidA
MEDHISHILDEVDYRIVAFLQKDGRIPNVEIARELGLAEGTVRKRLEWLCASEVIRITAIPDPDKLGLTTRIYIGIEADQAQLQAVAEQLAAIPDIRSVSIATGTYDVIVEAVLPSSSHLLSFLLDKVAGIPGVKRTETCHVLKMVKRARDWMIPNEHVASSTSRTPPSEEVIPGTIIVPS